MGKMKKTLVLLLALTTLFSLCSCKMVTVNTEKDKQTVIAKIDGEQITKDGFNAYYGMTRFISTLYSSSAAATDEELKTLKESTFDEYVINLCLKKECEANGLSSAETVSSTNSAVINYLITNYGNAAEGMSSVTGNSSFISMAQSYGLDPETFEADLKNYLELSSYYSLYTSADTDHSFMTDSVAAVINDKEISMGVFNYFLVYQLVYNYMYTGSTPSDNEAMLKMYDTVLEYIASAQEITDYAKGKGYTITDAEKQSALSSWLMQVLLYFDSDSMQSLYDSYYVTDADVDAAKNLIAESEAYKEKLSEGIAEEMKVKKSDVKKYYEANSSAYSDTVSAYHILCKDEATAQALYEQTGGTADGFMNVYSTAKSNAQVTEAADLGSFSYSDMVEEFSKAAFAMNAGEVKGPVATPYGYHIIYVYDKNEAQTLDEAYEEVEADYKASVQATYVEEQLAKIQKKANVKKKGYKILPEQRLMDFLYDKYGVKVYKNKATR